MKATRVMPLVPPPDRGPLLTPQRVAELIGGVSQRWVLRNVRPHVKLGQRTVRFYSADVAAWIARHRMPGADP